jgi:hypothetical protein
MSPRVYLALPGLLGSLVWAQTNPFCVLETERNTVTATLQCINGVIDSIPSAFFGTPGGTCPSFTRGDCDDNQFLPYARATCVGQTNCTLVSQGSDPCAGVVKSIFAVAHCSLPPGGVSPPQPPQPLPSPSCALNGLPCPTPTWAPSWNLTQSTVIQPGGASLFMPSHPWGIISLDWSVASSVWFLGNVSNTTCQATSTEGCRALKAAGLAHRCFIYANMELGLQWLETQRAAMEDPSKAHYFLQYTDGIGNKNGTIYNEPIEFGSQYFWDFTIAEAAAFFINAVLAPLNDPAVDGSFSDDVTGVPAEHDAVQGRINMTSAQLAALQYATQATSMDLIETLSLAGKYNWQAFGAQDGVNAGPNKGSCASWMREYCDPAYQGRPMMMGMDDHAVNQTVAAFLVSRPPHGYLGYGWESDDRAWNDIFLLQAGTPTGLCEERPAGIFTRAWTAGTALLDCNQWTADLPFPALVL